MQYKTVLSKQETPFTTTHKPREKGEVGKNIHFK